MGLGSTGGDSIVYEGVEGGGGVDAGGIRGGKRGLWGSSSMMWNCATESMLCLDFLVDWRLLLFLNLCQIHTS